MLHRIARILIFFVLLGLAHGAYVHLAKSRYEHERYDRYDKNLVNEYESQENLLRLEHYLFSSTIAPLVLTGTSITGILPTGAFRVPAESLTILGGDRTVLDLLIEQPALPSLILAETNNIMLLDEKHNWTKTANLVQKRHLRQCRTCFRPTVMLLTELTNLFNMVYGIDQDESAPQPPAPVSSSQNAARELGIQKIIGLFQKIPPSDDLNKAVAHFKQRIDQFNKRGTRVVLLEMPMDPRIAAAPHFAHINSAMRAAFPADHYQWITLRPDLFEFVDGMHLTPQSAQHAARMIDQVIASLGLYQQLGLVPAAGGKKDM